MTERLPDDDLVKFQYYDGTPCYIRPSAVVAIEVYGLDRTSVFLYGIPAPFDLMGGIDYVAEELGLGRVRNDG